MKPFKVTFKAKHARAAYRLYQGSREVTLASSTCTSHYIAAFLHPRNRIALLNDTVMFVPGDARRLQEVMRHLLWKQAYFHLSIAEY